MTPLAAAPDPAPRRRPPYKNWRPPIISVHVLVPVGATGLALPGFPDDAVVLPTGPVEGGQTPEEAAQAVFAGLPDGLPIGRRVAVDQVQMTRRKIISHIVVTAPLTMQEAGALTYRDPRTDVQVLPTGQAMAALPERARTRALLGFQAIAIGSIVYVQDGRTQRLESM
ncbi:hypothetical protein [Streptomyces chrestomyceticus]|uniref:hypothetical protein n=1 Tax=Streptomyces chrestomyceticus TaxID=68185 RepID=UPI0033F108BE